MSVINEIECLLQHLSGVYKQNTLLMLEEFRDVIIQDNNVLEIKADLVKRKLEDRYKCVLVDNTYYIIPINDEVPYTILQSDSMSKMEYVYNKAVASGPSELTAWLNEYDKHFVG